MCTLVVFFIVPQIKLVYFTLTIKSLRLTRTPTERERKHNKETNYVIGRFRAWLSQQNDFPLLEFALSIAGIVNYKMFGDST